MIKKHSISTDSDGLYLPVVIKCYEYSMECMTYLAQPTFFVILHGCCHKLDPVFGVCD